jgi:raffinose/stachyose/melibiose transport system permease protein
MSQQTTSASAKASKAAQGEHSAAVSYQQMKQERSIRAPKAHLNRTAGDWVGLILLIIFGIIILFPLIVLCLNAFKSKADYNASGPLSWPKEFDVTGLKTFWNTVNFPQKVWNSIWISALVAFFGVVLSVLNSFALGIGRVKGRRWMILLIMLANMMPQEALLYPLYMMFKRMGLYNSPWAIVIIFTVIQSAFGTYLLSSVYGTFPQAILEAAALDGASRWRILWQVVLPISGPTIGTLLVFFFVWTWNEYMIPMTFLISNSTQTVPLAIASLSGQRLMDVTTTAAASLISIVPTLIFYLIFQRTLSRGITAGAVK